MTIRLPKIYQWWLKMTKGILKTNQWWLKIGIGLQIIHRPFLTNIYSFQYLDLNYLEQFIQIIIFFFWKMYFKWESKSTHSSFPSSWSRSVVLVSFFEILSFWSSKFSSSYFSNFPSKQKTSDVPKYNITAATKNNWKTKTKTKKLSIS